jgi:hypothetical protein
MRPVRIVRVIRPVQILRLVYPARVIKFSQYLGARADRICMFPATRKTEVN